MSDSVSDKSSDKRSIGGELVIPIAALLFTLYYFYTIYDTPWTAQVSAVFVGSILLALIFVYFAKVFVQRKQQEVDLKMGALVEPVSYIPKRLLLFLLTVLFVWTVDWLGFTITVFLFLMASMFVLGDGKRPILVTILSTLLSVGGYLLFIVAFKTRFPKGPFEHLIERLF